MLDLSQGAAALLILQAFISGAVLGLGYDALKGMRMILFGESVGARGALKIARHALSFIFDVAFFLAFAVVAVALCYAYLDGLWRGIVYIAMAAGVLVYRLTLSRVAIFCERRVAVSVRRAIRGLMRLAGVPLAFICRRLISLYHLTIGKFLGKIRSRIKEASLRRKNTDISALSLQSI